MKQKSGFYQSFRDILSSVSHPALSPAETEGNDPADVFLKVMDAEKSKSSLRTVRDLEGELKELVPALKKAMAKPQRLLQEDPDWYVAQDLNTNTFYICYRTLLMIDIDFYKDSEKIMIDDPNNAIKVQKRQAEILDRLEDYALLNDLRFRIFRTRNGIHVFLVSRTGVYTNLADIKMMLDLGSDFFYAIYSHIRGWSVRLNRKARELEMAYPYLCDVGDVAADEYLSKLVDLHLNLLPVFANDDPSQMYGN
jgi:hypothetical protein